MRISDWSSDVCSSDLATRLCPVGEAPCRRADRLANSILRRVDLRPYGADGRGGCLAALHVELVHFVGDVLHLVDHAADLRTDAVDCELEGKADGVIRDRLQVGDAFRHVYVREGARDVSDAATARPAVRTEAGEG